MKINPLRIVGSALTTVAAVVVNAVDERRQDLADKKALEALDETLAKYEHTEIIRQRAEEALAADRRARAAERVKARKMRIFKPTKDQEL